MTEPATRLGLPAKLSLGLRLWAWFARVYVGVRRHPLPRFIERLHAAKADTGRRIEPVRLGRIVERVLRVGPWRPRCLFTSLVLYRLLVEQGDRPEVVIGLPREPRDKDAHAWIEIGGRDVGPPPGRSRHQVLARYG
jgi:hypothetical protein